MSKKVAYRFEIINESGEVIREGPMDCKYDSSDDSIFPRRVKVNPAITVNNGETIRMYPVIEEKHESTNSL